ncbi:hypothetical protein RAH41_22280 [Gottfriedia acidiceleris]|uniref:hypothetical protein n=1 Tax=Gottfriedia acidiceleris TaxID=371036 RepID=UPI002F266E5E
MFYSIVEEQVALIDLNEEEKEVYKEALVNFFDETSTTYQNLNMSQSELENNIEEISEEGSSNQVSYIKNVIQENVAINRASAAISVKIGVNFAGSVINVAIGAAVGVGVGAIQAFIIKKGKKEAEKMFTKTVISRLKAWGAKKLATSVGVAVGIAMDYMDIGAQITKQLDKRDKKPNNGWIDID